MSTELTITPQWIGRNGTARLIARIWEEVVHADEINAAKASARERFTADLVKCRPGIDAEAVEGKLLQWRPIARLRTAKARRGSPSRTCW